MGRQAAGQAAAGGGPEAPRAGTVEVLLSTFTGSRFLPELLASVLAQDYPDLLLSVRDDGSTDGTLGIVEPLLGARDGARVSSGPNIGAARSFLTLLSSVDPGAAYAAFCDQDDVWLPGKLSRAVAALGAVRGPALYCSAVQLVGEDLSPAGLHRRCVRGPSFANALVENVATGCTIVLNRPAIDLLARHLPADLLMHDAWCYLVLAGCGRVLYDPEPSVLYRLHGSNAVGVASTLWADWYSRARRHAATGHERVLTAQAAELGRLYGDELSPAAATMLDEFLSSQRTALERLRYALRGPAHRQRRADDLIYRVLYAARRI
ncbi:MAG: glycosyltransferase family 2 protein [Acidimicrobiales bacterium]